MEVVSRVHERNLVAWAKDRPEVVVFSGDLTGSTEIGLFQQTYPDRFFSLGMAEQNMLSWAGGMAREGFTPFLHTFAVFLYRRPLDQLSMSVAYPNLPVRLFGFLPGLTTPGGVTHQAIEDIAILRAIPNMTVIEVGDATDVESVLDAAQAVSGPVYVRMLRGEIPRLFPKNERLKLNQARILRLGNEVTIFSSGICTEMALRATQLLQQAGVSVTHLHISTLKPFSDPAVLDALRRPARAIISFENHSILGGLGTAVAETMAENGVGTPLVRMGIVDTYAHGASFPYLARKYGIDALALVRKVEAITGRNLAISESDLAAVQLDVAASPGMDQLEAL
jgi:transketolase